MEKKIISGLLVFFFLYGSVFGQNDNNLLRINDDNVVIDQAVTEQITPVGYSTRGQVSEWWEFANALAPNISNEKNIYSLLFPDTIVSIFEGSAPGTYTLSKVRDHSVGLVFSPYSDIMYQSGYHKFYNSQPYNVDTIAIQYNYNRYTASNITDTLVIDIFKPSKLLYYQSSGSPRGCSMGYDLANKKGRNYSQEVKILLTAADTITYKWRGKGWIYIPLSSFAITAGTYGNPVGFTVTFKPGTPYSTLDTLNGDFNPSVPHSAKNHFYFWNFTDYSQFVVSEWNNGVFIYSFTGATPYKYESSNGNVYYRGKDFSNRTCYPVAKFKITYDPAWVGVKEEQPDAGFAMYPNPVADQLNIVFNESSTGWAIVKITNMLGQIKSSFSIQNIKPGQRYSINTDAFERGIYILTISSMNGRYSKTFTKE